MVPTDAGCGAFEEDMLSDSYVSGRKKTKEQRTGKEL